MTTPKKTSYNFFLMLSVGKKITKRKVHAKQKTRDHKTIEREKKRNNKNKPTEEIMNEQNVLIKKQ